MPIFITQGRYTADAVKGMIARPEDRASEVAKLIAAGGGKLLAYYVTFGDYDFMAISEGADENSVAAVLFAAAAGGGVSHLRTTVAITSAEAKQAFGKAAQLTGAMRAAGAT